MAIVLFMLAQEQVDWLQKTFGGTGYWCWVRRLTHDSYLLRSPINLDRIDFGDRSLMELDFGSDRLHSPVVKKTGYGEDLDFTRSQTVQFAPSLNVPAEKVITRGQLAVAPAWSYDYDSVPYGDLFDWYKTLSRSLKKVMDRKRILFADDPGKRVYFRGWHISGGANAQLGRGWLLEGGLKATDRSELTGK